jgi:hypothetical protein
MAERGRFANLSKTRASAALNEVLTYEGSSRREILSSAPRSGCVFVSWLSDHLYSCSEQSAGRMQMSIPENE